MVKEKIVVVGFGWVGQANALSLSLFGYHVSYFDPAREIKRHYEEKYKAQYNSLQRLKNVTELDGEETIYVVCVGDKVSEDGDQDISAIKKALESLGKVKGTIVLRSTILPGLVHGLHFDFYVPEFLHEKKAVEECSHPHYFVVGAKGSRKKEPSFFQTWRKRAFRSFIGTPREASYIKYLSNLWNALRIAFVNEFGNAVAVPKEKEYIRQIERVTDFIFEGKGYLRYGRSFGGHCLPKDARAFLRWYREQGGNPALLEGMILSNEMHQKIENEHPTLPEWFSEWKRSVPSGKEALRHLSHALQRRLSKIFQ